MVKNNLLEVDTCMAALKQNLEIDEIYLSEKEQEAIKDYFNNKISDRELAKILIST